MVLLPLVLVGCKTIGARFVEPDSRLFNILEFIGHPFIAILVACLSGYWRLAIRRGMSKEKVMEVCSAAIQPAGIILLVTGAGGVFNRCWWWIQVGPALGMH